MHKGWILCKPQFQDSYETTRLLEEFKKCYSGELWNPNDPIGSHMALDCVAQVPEEMFSRNDKYGMAYSMEGRFPLATKIFMNYCFSMHTDLKLGRDKNDTKILIKTAYKHRLPIQIIKKQKLFSKFENQRRNDAKAISSD